MTVSVKALAYPQYNETPGRSELFILNLLHDIILASELEEIGPRSCADSYVRDERVVACTERRCGFALL
jgi:hypothetical protein